MGNLSCQKTLVVLCHLFTLACLTSQHNEGFVREVKQNYHEKLNGHIEQHILSYHNLELAYKAYAAYFDRADVDLPGFKKFFRKLEQRSLDNAISMTSYVNNRGGRVRFPVVQLKDACSYIEKLHGAANKTKPHICYFQSQTPDPYASKKLKDKGGLSGYSWPGWFSKGQNQNTQNEKDDIKSWRTQSGLHGLKDALALEKSVNDGLISLVKEAKHHQDPYTSHTVETFMEHQVDTIKGVADLVTRLQQYVQDNDYPLGEYLLDRELDE